MASGVTLLSEYHFEKTHKQPLLEMKAKWEQEMDLSPKVKLKKVLITLVYFYYSKGERPLPKIYIPCLHKSSEIYAMRFWN